MDSSQLLLSSRLYQLVLLVPLPTQVSGRSRIQKKVLAFGWLAILGRILMQGNLWKCKMIIVNGCPMSLKEAVDHLCLLSNSSSSMESCYWVI